MTQDEIIRMAREAGLGLERWTTDAQFHNFLERFATLVAAHEREKQAEQGWKYSPETGEPLIDGWPLFSCLPPAQDVDKDKIIENLTKLLELQTKSEEVAINMIEAAVLAEREACAKVCDEISQGSTRYDCAAAIRARGE